MSDRPISRSLAIAATASVMAMAAFVLLGQGAAREPFGPGSAAASASAGSRALPAASPLGLFLPR